MREWDAIGCGHFFLRAWHSYRIPHPSRRGMLSDFNMYGDLPYYKRLLPHTSLDEALKRAVYPDKGIYPEKGSYPNKGSLEKQVTLKRAV